MGLSPRPPSLILSTRATRLRGPSTLIRWTHDLGLDGVDLDLTGRLVAADPLELAVLAATERVAIRSVHVGFAGFGAHPRWNDSVRAKAAIAVARRTNARIIARLPDLNAGRFDRQAIASLSERVRSDAGSHSLLTLMIPPRWLVGGRAHLVLLTSLRRLAEEWEFDLGLDLSGSIGVEWEAEAAVLRLGRRLKLVRVSVLPMGNGAPSASARLSARAIVPALESDALEAIILAPTVPLWRPTATAFAIACDALSDHILARFAKVSDALLSESSTDVRARNRT